MGRTVPACVNPCKRPHTHLTLILLSSRSNTGWAKICQVVILHAVRTTNGIKHLVSKACVGAWHVASMAGTPQLASGPERPTHCGWLPLHGQ